MEQGAWGKWRLLRCHDGFWWEVHHENFVVVVESCVVDVGFGLREGVIAVKESVYQGW